VLLFFVLMILVIPFFHGAVRHLFATYVEDGESSQIKHWAILIDYYLLFAEGGVFVALACRPLTPMRHLSFYLLRFLPLIPCGVY
jgi:hypothetical protein